MVEYVFVKLVDIFGVCVGVYIGYSIGEYIVVILVGVFDLQIVIKMVLLCVCFMYELLFGVMVVVVFGFDDVMQYLLLEVELFVVNDFGNCVVVGFKDQICVLC